jgi:two-component sensor histidine kinase
MVRQEPIAVPPWRTSTFGGTPRRASPPRAGLRFESLARLASRDEMQPRYHLGLLLACALPIGHRGCEVLKPLWAEEAMHRAYNFMRLIDAGSSAEEQTSENRLARGKPDALARDLAARFRDLETSDERVVLPCSAVLRDVVACLVWLFGSPINVSVETRVMDVALPAYKRRALVLAAAELVANALLHAFRGRQAGRMEVDLIAGRKGAACLRIADNGIGMTGRGPNLHCGVASGLADLLEADLTYDRIAGWTIAEIGFPVSGS